MKDNGVIWIWDNRARVVGMPERLNTLIIRDAPSSEADTQHTSGAVRIYDAPRAQYKDVVFPWTRSGPVVTHCCGPGVTEKLIGVLRTAIEDYNKTQIWNTDPAATHDQKLERLNQWLGQGWWNIDVLRDKGNFITPAGCATPKGSECEGSVTLFGKCFQAGIVNYTLYGAIEGLTSTALGGFLHSLYWSGKVIGNIATLHWSAAADAPRVGYLESKMVNAGIAFIRGGRGAMQAEGLSIPSLARTPNTLPPKPYGWRYTWAPKFMDQPSRY